jgi:hypothetical protein
MEQLMAGIKETIHNAFEGGAFMERRKLIAFLEGALTNFADMTLGDALPLLIQTLKDQPAPEEYIKMQKFKLKHGISDGELQEFLQAAIKRVEDRE